MYKGTEKQIQFIEFNLPFGGKLLANNRWIRLSQMIPWHEFGQGKQRYGIGRLIPRLASTSEMAIAMCFLVMNLEKWLAAIFLPKVLKSHVSRLTPFSLKLNDCHTKLPYQFP